MPTLDEVVILIEQTAQKVTDFTATSTKSYEALKSEIDENKKKAVELAEKEDTTKVMVKFIEDRVNDLVESLAFKQSKAKPASLSDQTEVFLKSDEYKGYLSQKNQKAQFELKADTLVSLVGEIPQSTRLGGVSEIKYPPLSILPHLNLTPFGGAFVSWVEKYNKTGEPVWRNYGEAGANIAFDLQVKSTKVKDLMAFIEVPNEMLEDFDSMMQTINFTLVNELNKSFEAAVMTGNGTNNPKIFDGLLTIATAYDSASNPIAKPNDYDVLCAAVSQVAKTHYSLPTVVWVSHDTELAIRNMHLDNGAYLFPTLVGTNQPINIKGAVVVPTPLITDNSFLVADAFAVNDYIRKGITVDVSSETSENFKKNISTVRGIMRATQFVSANDIKGIVKGTVGAAGGTMRVKS